MTRTLCALVAALALLGAAAATAEAKPIKFRVQIVIAKKSFAKQLYPDAATIDMATNVHWQVTLTRLR